MKLSQHIAKMQALLAKWGDLDVVCTTGGPTTDADNEYLEERHVQVIENISDTPIHIHPHGATAPYVLIGGEE